MTYTILSNGNFVPYSISQLKSENPNVSFPRNIPDEMLLEYGVYRVEISPPEGYHWTGAFDNDNGTPVPVYEETPPLTEEELRNLQQIQFENPALLRKQLETVAQLQLTSAVIAGTVSTEQYTAIATLYPEWQPGVAVTAGKLLLYKGLLYEVITGHTTQADWLPPEVPALFTERRPSGYIGEWIQPINQFNWYNAGDRVYLEGVLWESDIDGNVWKPGEHGWSRV